ncbi:MAG: hypothetical protein DCC65_06585 [Planctomycetota bacterium]|nr:MAG: hypothetical protein DCC65_06585 [Planctomycetota bacterium]
MVSILVLILNLVIPGTGLIARRREWLGFSLALLFGICGNVGLASWLIAPEALPSWLTYVAFALAGLTWLLAQFLYARQCRHLSRCEVAVRGLVDEGRAALERGDVDAANAALCAAAAIDEEHLELNVLRARLLARTGDEVEARRYWRRVLELDRAGGYRGEARGALAGSEPAAPGAAAELRR